MEGPRFWPVGEGELSMCAQVQRAVHKGRLLHLVHQKGQFQNSGCSNMSDNLLHTSERASGCAGAGVKEGISIGQDEFQCHELVFAQFQALGSLRELRGYD